MLNPEVDTLPRETGGWIQMFCAACIVFIVLVLVKKPNASYILSMHTLPLSYTPSLGLKQGGAIRLCWLFTPSVAQDDLKLVVLLSLPSKCGPTVCCASRVCECHSLGQTKLDYARQCSILATIGMLGLENRA